MKKINKRTLMLICLIMLLGVLLRVYNIGKEDFWLDEAYTATSLKLYNAKQVLYNTLVIGNILPGILPATTDPPVYYITLYYWTKLFSISETSLRLYSVVIWVFSAIYMFLLANKLFGKKSAIVSSFLFSISIPAIAFSQEARGYMLYLFFALASMYYLFKALDKNKNYDWAMYAVFVVLGHYTHHLFAILLFFQVLYIAYHLIVLKRHCISNILRNLFRKKDLSKIFYVFLILAIVLFPIVPRLLRENVTWWGKPNVMSAAKIFMNFATWIYPTIDGKGKINNGLVFELNAFDMAIFLSAVITSILSYSLLVYLIHSKSKIGLKNFFGKENKIVFISGWFAFPLAFALIFSIAMPISVFSTFHYFFYGLPPFIMLVAQGMLGIKKMHFKLLLAFFILVNIVPLYAYYFNVDKQQWKEVAQYLKGRLDKDEVVIVSIYSGEISLKYYFGDDERIHGVKRLDEELKNLIKDKKRLWLVLTFWKYYDPEGSVQKYINENYEVIESRSFFDIEVYHYQKRVYGKSP